MSCERYVRHAAALTRALTRALARALAVALALGAAGPALAAPADADLLERAVPCCDDPARFAFDALPSAGDVDFTIDRRSPLFEFQSGRSFFRAFRLPEQGPAYTLELRSFLDRPDSPRTARVFYPVMAILTDDFLVSRATDLDALRFDLPVLERTSAPAYRVQLPVDPANTRERYVVVFTPEQLMAPRDLGVASAETAAQAARSAFLGASAFGRLRFTLRPRTGADDAANTVAPDEAPSHDAPEEDAAPVPDLGAPPAAGPGARR